MFKRLISLAAFAAILAIPATLSAQATGSVCTDGTKSNATGSGACSGHGGVDQAATTAMHNAAKKPKPAPAPAAPPGNASAAVKCKDGTMSNTSGSGACSHHGGVAAANANAAVAAAPAPATAPAPRPAPAPAAAPANAATGATKCKDGTMSNTSGSGACSHHGGVATVAAGAAVGEVDPKPISPKAPAPTSSQSASDASTNTTAQGATAMCKDGSYSHSTHHSGTCSNHGGVKQWLDGTKPKS